MPLRWPALAACFLTTALAAWAFWLEPASIRVEPHRLELSGWPADCSGLRVALLTDLHIGSPFNGLSKLEEVVSLTQATDPDLILLAGDYVIQGVLGGSFEPPEPIAQRLGKLSAPDGIHAVLGNHDHWFDPARVRAALEAASISVLEDRAVHVTRGGCDFWLVGVSDFWEGAHDVARALGSVPPGAPTLVFTHNPDVFPHLPETVTLAIAGHTHGGQVDLPFLGRLVVPSAYGERYAIGEITENGRHGFVGSGIGTSILPVRFRVPPEISVLTLESSPAQSD